MKTNPYETDIKKEEFVIQGAGHQSRDISGVKDQLVINCYQETLNNSQKALVKRPGILRFVSQVAQAGRGIFGWNGNTYYVLGDKLYKDTSTTELTTLSTSSGFVGFCECTVSGVHTLFMCDGTDGYLVETDDTVTQIVDADFPSPHIPTPVYIDGYVALLQNNNGSADVYTSDLEQPASWTSSNFLTAEELPDGGVALARQNNQIVVFGTTSTEFFYVDPNNVTGTPLSRNSGAFQQIGCGAPYAVGQNERYCFFIGTSGSGGRTVWKLDGFQPEEVGTPAINRYLEAEGDGITAVTGFLIRVAGHFFYGIRLSNHTFIFDVLEQEWHEWKSQINSTTNLYAIGGPTELNNYYINKPTTASSITYVQSNFAFVGATDPGTGIIYLLPRTSGTIGYLDTGTYKDLGIPMKVEYQTNNMDFNSYLGKFMHRMDIYTDLNPGGTLIMKWTDNDYSSWSNNKTIDLSTRPSFTRVGKFRRRAFYFSHDEDAAFRLLGLNFIYSEGDS